LQPLKTFLEQSSQSWKQETGKMQRNNRKQNKSVSNPVINDDDGEQALNQAIRHIFKAGTDAKQLTQDALIACDTLGVKPESLLN
jgi:hypothetical protein